MAFKPLCGNCWTWHSAEEECLPKSGKIEPQSEKQRLYAEWQKANREVRDAYLAYDQASKRSADLLRAYAEHSPHKLPFHDETIAGLDTLTIRRPD